MTAEELVWVIIATIVAGLLKWAENRWPGPQDPPRRRRRRPRPDDESD